MDLPTADDQITNGICFIPGDCDGKTNVVLLLHRMRRPPTLVGHGVVHRPRPSRLSSSFLPVQNDTYYVL